MRSEDLEFVWGCGAVGLGVQGSGFVACGKGYDLDPACIHLH